MEPPPEPAAERPTRHHPWSWRQFGIALGLFPVSFILWLVGMEAVFGPHRNPIAEACLVVAPFIGLAGVLWLLVLLVRRWFF